MLLELILLTKAEAVDCLNLKQGSIVHEYGSVHCDIKPYKKLMATAGLFAATKHVSKIGDFGTAKKAN